MSLKIASKSMRNSPASWIVPGGERAGVRLQRDATRKWGRRTRAVAALAHSDDKVAVWALEEDPDADLQGWHWWWGSSGGWGRTSAATLEVEADGLPRLQSTAGCTHLSVFSSMSQ